MRVMAIAWIVQVEKLGLRVLQNEFDVLHHRAVALFLHFLTWIAELRHKTVLAHIGGLALLDQAHLLHLFVRVLFIRPFARTTGPVGDHDASEPFVATLEALRDAMVGGDLQVVLMGNDAQVRHSAQRSPGFGLIRDENVMFGMAKGHGAALSAWARSAQGVTQPAGICF